ncbi:uncharacterized protein LOC129776146 [Toxorhynchites rutilus septentrionalis]|uniref:uncharacterized protein LOC129776146 n=1 Tax=Toxorhynchites rutilus septentrionalis TaxID=329112 RepID=UPI002479533A|nr:uncharacterized protein LOC129776146 [Toxorhynchites rutilus septentrionalis]
MAKDKIQDGIVTNPNDCKPAPKRKRTAANQNGSKRLRKDAIKTERSIQWVDPGLKYIQSIAGQPNSHAFDHYTHASVLQLPLQPANITQESLHRHFERTPWNSSYPVPLVTHRTPERMLEVDPMIRLVKTKKTHLVTLNNMKRTYNRKRTMARKICKQNNGALYPTAVSLVAEHMERDPDPWFEGSIGYDYYFTGCNLAVIEEGEFKWIVNTVGREMNTVEMIPFNTVDNRLEIDSGQIERYEFERETGPVFEVSWSKSEDSCTQSTKTIIKIALRRKHNIEVMWTNQGHDSLKTKRINSKIPFISHCLLPGRNGWLMCTSDLEKNIKLWDCKENKILYSLKLQKEGPTDDCWQCVRVVANGFVICLNRTSFELIKIDGTDLVIVRTINISDLLWKCEKASCMEVCTKNRILLLGTTHKLLIISLIEKKEKEPDFQHILTFTHNLKQHPTMISMGSDSKQNIHAWISSQLPGDSKICSFTKAPIKRFISRFVPMRPLNIQDACQLARIQGKCIYPASALQQHLQRFQCGSAIIVSSGHFHLLSQNSSGDIFHQQLTQDSTVSNASMVPDCFQSWLQQLNTHDDIEHKPIATDFKNLRSFRKILTCSSLQPKSDLRPTNHFFKKRPRWQQPVEQLHQYKDLLAGDMLAIWGFRPDVTKNRRPSTDDTINPTDRVFKWLDTAVDTDATFKQESIKIEDTFIERYSSCDAVASSNELKMKSNLAESQETFMLDDLVVSHSVVKSTKRKYVQGF